MFLLLSLLRSYTPSHPHILSQAADDELADIEAAIFMKSMGEIEVVSKEDKARQEKLAAQAKTPWCVAARVLKRQRCSSPFFCFVFITLLLTGAAALVRPPCRHKFVDENELIIKSGLVDKRKVSDSVSPRDSAI